MIERPVVEQFYYILETFPILWLYQQSIKYFAIYEEKSKCVRVKFKHIGTKNDGEKWSKNVSEIPPSASYFWTIRSNSEKGGFLKKLQIQ